MNKFLKPLDYIFVLRPTSFFSVWTIFLAGFFVQNKFGVAATPSSNGELIISNGQSDFLWVGLFLTLLIGAVFILNQIKDRPSGDNTNLTLIGQEHLTPKFAFFQAIRIAMIEAEKNLPSKIADNILFQKAALESVE